jgi:MATE family, multidrug efflux pump
LRIVGPAFGFFGLGLSLYFASQGAGRLLWPLIGSFVRLVIAVGGGWLVLRWTGSVHGLFAAMTFALVVYGILITMTIASGAWFDRNGATPPR